MFSKYDLHEAMKFRVGELPFDRKITPQEMRVGLARASYYSTVIRNVRTMAELEGWNGEDTMTAIAFYTTLQLEVAQQSMHDVFAKSANPIYVFPDRPPAPTKDAKFACDGDPVRPA